MVQNNESGNHAKYLLHFHASVSYSAVFAPKRQYFKDQVNILVIKFFHFGMGETMQEQNSHKSANLEIIILNALPNWQYYYTFDYH